MKQAENGLQSRSSENGSHGLSWTSRHGLAGMDWLAWTDWHGCKSVSCTGLTEDQQVVPL